MANHSSNEGPGGFNSGGSSNGNLNKLSGASSKPSLKLSGASVDPQQQERKPSENDKIDLNEPLNDDGMRGITFKSFNVEEVLGEGTFGKVFKVQLKDDPNKTNYAMKVLRKGYLVKNNHLKYAISEANILRRT